MKLKKYLPSLVCGFSAGVLQVVPLVKSFSCCLVLPLAAFVALILEQKSTNNFNIISAKKAVMIGLFTGLFAALFGSFFEILITFITKQNDIIITFPELQKMVGNFPVTEDIKKEVLLLFQNVRNDILTTGFSWLYTFSLVVNDFFIDILFGIAGGLIGSQIINKRINNSKYN
jgi:hypothetical protein